MDQLNITQEPQQGNEEDAAITLPRSRRPSQEALHNRLEIWRSEVDESELVCGCSARDAKSTDKDGRCSRCRLMREDPTADLDNGVDPNQPPKSKSQRGIIPRLGRKLTKGATSWLGKIRKKSPSGDGHESNSLPGANTPQAPGSENVPPAVIEGPGHVDASTPAREGEREATSTGPGADLGAPSSTQPPPPPTTTTRAQTQTRMASGTNMYRSYRETGAAGAGGAPDSASVSTLLGALSSINSHKNVRRGKPKLTLDDTAARLRRAQRLLNAQGLTGGPASTR